MNKLKLKAYREASKISQREVARLIDTPHSNYWKWESGKSTPDAKQILKLCKVFNCTPNDLYGIRSVYEVTTMTWDD